MPAEPFARLLAILEIVFAIAARRLQAVVFTTIGAEGFPVHPGQDILIADGPGEFADQTIQLLRAPTRRAELGRTARELVERTYSWDAIVQPFEKALNMLAEREEKLVSS